MEDEEGLGSFWVVPREAETGFLGYWRAQGRRGAAGVGLVGGTRQVLACLAGEVVAAHFFVALCWGCQCTLLFWRGALEGRYR